MAAGQTVVRQKNYSVGNVRGLAGLQPCQREDLLCKKLEKHANDCYGLK